MPKKAIPFIDKFNTAALDVSTREKLAALKENFCQFCGDYLDNSIIFQTVSMIGQTCQTVEQLMTLLEIVQKPYVQQVLTCQPQSFSKEVIPLLKVADEAFCKKLLTANHPLSTKEWFFILTHYADNHKIYPAIIEYLKKTYAENYVNIFCLFLSDKGLRSSSLAEYLITSDTLTISAVYHKKQTMDDIQKFGANYWITKKAELLLQQYCGENIQIDKQLFQEMYHYLTKNIIARFKKDAEGCIQDVSLAWLESGCHVYEPSNHGSPLFYSVDFMDMSKLRNELSGSLVKIERLIKCYIQYTNVVEAEPAFSKRMKMSVRLLRDFLSSFSAEIEHQKNLLEALKQQRSHLKSNLLALFLNPHVYYNLTPDELNFFFTHGNPEQLAKVIVEYYQRDQYFPFQLQRIKISFEDLELIVSSQEKIERLDEANRMRFVMGLPIVIPPGSVNIRTNHVEDTFLPLEHRYPLSERALRAAEKYLRIKYQHYLCNKPISLSEEGIEISIPVVKLPYKMYLINDIASLEKFIFTSLLSQLRSYSLKNPVILCGGMFFKNGGYRINYFIYPRVGRNDFEVLLVDSSADKLEDGFTIKYKTERNRQLQTLFKRLFEDQNMSAACTVVDVTLQHCHSDITISTLNVIEQALFSLTTCSPLIDIVQDRLRFNESALSYHGNPYCHYNLEKDTYFYTAKFVEACYEARARWHEHLGCISSIDYVDMLHLLGECKEEKIYCSEAYNFREDVWQAYLNCFFNHDVESMADCLRSKQSSDDNLPRIFNKIKMEFLKNLLSSEDKLKQFINALKSALDDNTANALLARSQKYRISLETFISYIIIKELRNDFRGALDKQIDMRLSALAENNIDYDKLPKTYLIEWINTIKNFAYFFSMLAPKEYKTAREDWDRQITEKLTALKIAQAKKTLLSYLKENLSYFIRVYNKHDTFAKACLTDILNSKTCPVYSAAKFINEHQKLESILSQLNSELSIFIFQYIQKISHKVIETYCDSINLNNGEIINGYYSQERGGFILTDDLVTSFLESHISTNYPDLIMTSSFLLELKKSLVDNFHLKLCQTLSDNMKSAVPQFLKLPALTSALKSYPNEKLYLLQNSNAYYNEAYIDEVASLIQQFGQKVGIFPILLSFNEDFRDELLSLIHKQLSDFIRPILDKRFQESYYLIVVGLLQLKANNQNITFDKNTIRVALEQVNPKIPEESILCKNIRKHPKTLINLANQLYDKYRELLDEALNLQKSMAIPDVLELLGEETIEALSCIFMKLQNEIKNITSRKSEKQLFLDVRTNIQDFKLKLIGIIQERLRVNLKNNCLLNNHKLRQVLLSLITVDTYYDDVLNRSKPFPYFILFAEEAASIDRYLVSQNFEAVLVNRAHGRLLGAKDREPFEPLPYLRQFKYDEKTGSVSLLSRKKNEPLPPKPYALIQLQNLKLTLRFLQATLMSWIDIYQEHITPSFIVALNDIISALPAGHPMDAPLPAEVITKILSEMDSYYLQNIRVPGTDIVAYYLSKTAELSQMDVLSLRFLRNMIQIYYGNLAIPRAAELQKQTDTMQVSSYRAFSHDAFFKTLRASSRIKKLEKLLESFAQENVNLEQDTLTEVQKSQLLTFVQEQLTCRNKDRYYFRKTLTHADKLFIDLARHMLKKDNKQGYLFHWLCPEDFEPFSLADYQYPESICAVLSQERTDTSVNDLEIKNVFLLESGHVVDINWVISEYKTRDRFVNPYTLKDLTKMDMKRMLSVPSPEVQALINLWIQQQQKENRLAHLTLSERCVEALFQFCFNAFFPRGISAYYNQDEEEKFSQALETLYKTVNQFSSREKERFYSYPVPYLNNDKTSTLKEALTAESCVVGIIKRLALVIYAYDHERVQRLADYIQSNVRSHLETNKISHETYFDGNLKSNAISDMLKESRKNMIRCSDQLFCDALIEKYEQEKQEQCNSHQKRLRIY